MVSENLVEQIEILKNENDDLRNALKFLNENGSAEKTSSIINALGIHNIHLLQIGQLIVKDMLDYNLLLEIISVEEKKLNTYSNENKNDFYIRKYFIESFRNIKTGFEQYFKQG